MRRWYHCFCRWHFYAVSIASIYNSSMTTFGLAIRIPRESLIKLSDLQGKRLIVKFNGGRELVGKLMSWDKAMNLILEST